jgi:general secretion pathway protein K
MRRPSARGKERGLALVAVLWAVALLTIMAASFSLTMQRDSSLVRNAQDRAQGLALADAGVHYAMLKLSLPDQRKRWRSDGTLYEATLPVGRVRMRIFDEAGKIDINAAQEAVWVGMLTKLLGNVDQATMLSDAILDWRDMDDLKRLHGAEAEDYQAKGKGYVPQNRDFQALEELQMVLGMTPALYKKLEPSLTVYTRQAGINPAKSSREALLALPGLDEKTVSDYLLLRRERPANNPPPLPIPPGGVQLATGGDMAYTVLAEARLPGGDVAGIKAVIKRQRSRSGAPFAIMSWKPQVPGTVELPDAQVISNP